MRLGPPDSESSRCGQLEADDASCVEEIVVREVKEHRYHSVATVACIISCSCFLKKGIKNSCCNKVLDIDGLDLPDGYVYPIGKSCCCCSFG